jgi:queuine/archaeosine tRNA-ribosyltransferase
MEEIRDAIDQDSYSEFKRSMLDSLGTIDREKSKTTIA